MSCISREEALVYIAAYLTDISRKEPDAKFSLQELGLNMLAGGLSGGLLGGGAAVAGGINTTAETFDYPAETDVQQYKPIIFDITETIDTQYKGMKCKATKVISYDNDIYISDRAKVKRRQLHYTNTRINEAAQTVGGKSSYRKPRILICDVTELPFNTTAVYNPADNTLRLSVAVMTKQGVLDLPKTVAGAENHNNVFVHEMLHWLDAQRYIERHGAIDAGYMNTLRAESFRQLEKLGINKYNVNEISKYASNTYIKGWYDEAWTEYRVKQLLKGE